MQAHAVCSLNSGGHQVVPASLEIQAWQVVQVNYFCPFSQDPEVNRQKQLSLRCQHRVCVLHTTVALSDCLPLLRTGMCAFSNGYPVFIKYRETGSLEQFSWWNSKNQEESFFVLFSWSHLATIPEIFTCVDHVVHRLQSQLTWQVTWHGPSPHLQFSQAVLLSSSTCEYAWDSSRVREDLGWKRCIRY